MAQNNLEGTATLSANGTTVIAGPPFPVAGAYMVELVSNSWSGGSVTPVVRALAGSGAWTNTIYTRPGTSGDIAAGTALTGAAILWIRADQVEAGLTVSSYGSGTMTVNWKWVAGGG